MNNIITRGLGLFNSLIVQGYTLFIRIDPGDGYKEFNATGAIQDVTPKELKKFIQDLVDTKKIVLPNNKKDIDVEVFVMKNDIRISIEEQESLKVPVKIKVTIYHLPINYNCAVLVYTCIHIT